MTTALCFNCGELKFGAFCPCKKCGNNFIGDKGLALLFSDQTIDEPSLVECGKVIRQISEQTQEIELKIFAFAKHVLTHNPELGELSLEVELEYQVEKLLAKCSLPSLIISLRQESEHGDEIKILHLARNRCDAYIKTNKCADFENVEVRAKNGAPIAGRLVLLADEVCIVVDENAQIEEDTITHIRKSIDSASNDSLPGEWISLL